MENKKTYPIGVVAKKTGLSSNVIRAWERRYQAIEPSRTDSNRRLYSEKDISRLKLLKKVSDSGMNIGDIARMSNEDLRRISCETDESVLALTGPEPPAGPHRMNAASALHLEECLSATHSLAQKRLEHALVRAAAAFSESDLLDEVIIPLITRVGRLWEQEHFNVGNEHLVSAVLRTFLENVRTHYKPFQGASRMILTTPTGHLHELGALLAATTAASAGWEVIYLGPNLPGNEIAHAARQAHAHAVALSLVYPLGDPAVKEDLKVLGRSLPGTVKVFAGGRAVPSYRETLQTIQGRPFASIAEFRHYLERRPPA